jgi:hypothetical protein
MDQGLFARRRVAALDVRSLQFGRFAVKLGELSRLTSPQESDRHACRQREE